MVPSCGWGTQWRHPGDRGPGRRPESWVHAPRWLVTAEPWRRLSRHAWRQSPTCQAFFHDPHSSLASCFGVVSVRPRRPCSRWTAGRRRPSPDIAYAPPLCYSPGVWWAGTLTLGAGFQVDPTLPFLSLCAPGHLWPWERQPACTAAAYVHLCARASCPGPASTMRWWPCQQAL